MKKLFDISQIENNDPVEIKGFVSAPTDQPHSRFFRGASLDALCTVLPLPLAENTVYDYVSRGDWSHFELLEYILNNIQPAQLYFSTWSISELSARKLVGWLDSGRITSVVALVDFRAKNRHPAAYHLARHHISDMRVGSCHAKVTVLKHAAGYVTIVGSANWTENPRIEAGIISTNESTGLGHIKWIQECVSNGEYELY